MCAYLVLAAALLVAYWVAPGDPAWRGTVYAVSTVTSLVALAVGVRRALPAVRRYWLALLAAVALLTALALPSAIDDVQQGSIAGWSGAGAVSFVGYALLAYAMVGLARTGGAVRGRVVWLEAFVGTLTFTVQWWIMSGHDALTRPGVPHEVVMASLYPLTDLALIVPTMVILSSRSGHDTAARALAIAGTADIAGDMLFVAFLSDGNHIAQLTFPFAWMLQGVFLGVAGLMSHRAIATPAIGKVSPAIVALLLFATVAPLVTIVVQTGWGADRPTVQEIVITLLAAGIMLGLTTLRIRWLVQRIEQQAVALEATSRTDDLTGLPNRRAGTRLLETAVRGVAEGEHQGLAVAVIDLDHFKHFNDTHGHLQGDRLLQDAGRTWTAILDGAAILYRHGGEEFVAILPDLDTDAVNTLLDELRRAMPRAQSFSAGVASLRPGESADCVFARADRCLYEAKAAGRGITITSP